MAPSKKFLQPINLLNAASDPSSADRGDFYYNTTSEKIRYYDGTQWNDVGTGTGGGTSIIVSETEPTPTAEGEAWFKSSTSELFIWDGTYWIEATSVVSQLFYVSSTQPNSPQTGSGWLDTTTNSFYIYDGTSWVSASSPDALTEIVQDTTPQLGGDLDGNGFGLDNIDYIDFDTTTTTVPTEGAVVWNSGEGTLSLGLLGGNVDLDIGQENVVLCYNGTGADMAKGDVVYISGAQGQKPSITLSSASSESSSSKTLGVVAEAIVNGADGFVTTFGMVKGLNTSTFTEGAALWLSTTAGDLTQTIPTSPNHAVFVGYCLKSDASAGRIFVNPQNGYELEELHNVLITSVQDADVLAYDSATSLWKNVAGYATETYVDTAESDAVSTANSYADSLASNYDAAGSASAVASDLTDHENSTTNVHGIADTSALATKTYADNAASTAAANLVDSAPGTLDTLNELAAALGDDPNFAATVTNSIAGKQPLDADLTAIAGLAGTSGFLKKTAADTWSLDTNTYLTGNQTITLSGDVSGSGTTSITVTVADDSHNHVISNVDGLQTALDGKVDLSGDTLTGALNWVDQTGISAPVTVQGDNLDVPIFRVSSNTLGSSNADYGFTLKYMGARSGNDNTLSFYSDNQVGTAVEALVIKQDGSLYQGGLTNKIWHSGNDGSGSGLDADLLDGQHGSYYATDSAVVHLAGTETITGAKTFSATINGADIHLTGSLTATSKSFDIEHPTKEGMRLRYGSLEGEEHGVYIRGKSKSSTITLPDYWTGLVDEDSITVQLTPIGKHKKLYVKDISNNTVTIGGCRGDFEFFYFIQAERKDIDKLVVEYGS